MGNAKTRTLETLAAVHGADLMASLAPGDRHADRRLMGLENMAYFLLQHHPVCWVQRVKSDRKNVEEMTLTAEQKRQTAQKHYNASLGECPARQLLEAISSKWVTLIMLALEDGQQRHSDLRRTIPGASQKMLTSTLRSLERDGLVSRHVTVQVPVRTDYELTERGHSLLPIVFQLKEWAEANMDGVSTSRMEHDRHNLAF